MATPAPRPQLSKSDKRLIVLLSRVLSETSKSSRSKNVCEDITVFSDAEFSELSDLIEEYIHSKQFIDGSLFVEEMSNGDSEGRAKKIYLDRLGKSRVMSSMKWADFETRLGSSDSITSYRRTQRMENDYFRNLESRLLRSCGVNANVTELVISMIDLQNQQIDELRSKRRQLRRGFIKEIVFNPIRSLRDKFESSTNKISRLEIPTQKLVGAITVVSDTSVLFTTRDWGVAGTISTMAGAMIAATAH